MRHLLIFIFVGLFSQEAKAQTTPLKEPLVHTVLFYLHRPDHPQDRAEFEKAIGELMKNNPQGVHSFLGKPANTKARGVVQTDYTYLYLMTFASIEAEAAYQTDATHLAFIEQAQHLWKKVEVFDAIDPSHVPVP